METNPSHLSAGKQTGDYLLREVIYQGETITTWKAEQVSVSREVIIDSLNPEQQHNEQVVSSFLGDVRAKARVDHPLIGSVFEAIREDNLCFYARENLAGYTLAELAAQPSALSPKQVVHIIRQIAEANLYLEQNGIASLPLQTDQIYISQNELCRLVNMAVGGSRDHAVSTQDKHTLAVTLISLLDSSEAGATRTRSLLDYMADLERDIPLTWEQVRELSEGVERQLSEPVAPLPLKDTTMKLQSSGIGKKAPIIALSVVVTLAVIFLANTLLNRNEKPKQRDLHHMVHIPAGRYPTHDGGKTKLPEFWIDSYEVTIAEYAKFLSSIGKLTSDQVAIYEHEDQPEEKTGHLPDDWENLYAAAKSGGEWKGLKIDLNCPVVGVDWWDAYTYCSHTRKRLPTQEEWYATLSASISKDSKIDTSAWGAVDQTSGDTTSNGIHGLAGNVSEWAGKLAKNPTFPTKSKMPLILGGSYTNKRASATSREWLPEDSTSFQDARSVRRSNLGFRTVSDSAPTH